RRMLLTMKAQTEAMRALAYVCGAAFDRAARTADAARRAYWQRRGDLLTPITKGWCTETGIELASLGVQVHGGMGFVEETGAAQHLRDVRITTIYEGTTGVQAQDLVGRKTQRDGGHGARELLTEIGTTVAALGASSDARAQSVGRELAAGVAALESALAWLLEAAGRDARLPAAASVHYLRLWGIVCGGWLLGESALACLRGAGDDAAFRDAKLHTAQFFAVQVLNEADTLRRKIVDGSAAVLALDAAAF
ncbi:MAG: acyl-CoA dehydrogenase C-terminal domain-containing protein, partial [Gammaproteobacteria bacterium]